MRLLLDTHVVLWCFENSRRLKPSVRQAITHGSNQVYVSAVTPWELIIKTALGKIQMPDDFESQLRSCGFATLPIQVKHALRIRALPELHRDPFDRMLIAQAIAEDLTLVSHDAAVWQYDVSLLKA